MKPATTSRFVLKQLDYYRVVYKFSSSRSFVKSRRLLVRRTHTMGSFLGGPGACSPGKFLKSGTLENAFPGILGHEAQTSEE